MSDGNGSHRRGIHFMPEVQLGDLVGATRRLQHSGTSIGTGAGWGATPEWLKEVLLTVIGSSSLAAGIGWWFKTRRDDRIARELAYVAQIKELQQELRASQQEVKACDQDRIQYEVVRRESSDQTMSVLKETLVLLKAGKGGPT